jgi:hypothetical protein
LQYDSGDDVDEYNRSSYEHRQLTKFQNEDLRVMRKGKYFCPFCPNKIKAGDRQSLEMHALDLRHTSEKIPDRADHQALAKFLYGDNLPEFGRPSRRRRH